MILQDAFTVEPWNLRETRLDLDLLAPTESVFALANGHVGWRANLDEGEPPSPTRHSAHTSPHPPRRHDNSGHDRPGPVNLPPW